VAITQELGGSFTVMAPDHGGLFRIQGCDADAIGREIVEHAAADGVFEIERVWEQLKQVYDPEIPVNIVDLGLVYGVQIEPLPSGRSRVAVQMTLTAPGCGMGGSIAGEVEYKLLNTPGVEEAQVQIVWDPSWHQSMISEAGRKVLGLD
jgi:probable FeS assembly SUF system protein SufT